MSAPNPFAELAELDAVADAVAESTGERATDLSDAYVRFEAEEELYALPLAAIREVIAAGGYAKIPRAPRAVIGLINHGGRIHTVVDLAAFVRDEPGRPRNLVLLVDDPIRRLGFGVDRIDGIGALAVEGDLARHGDRAVTVIRPEALAMDVDHAFESVSVLTSPRPAGPLAVSSKES